MRRSREFFGRHFRATPLRSGSIQVGLPIESDVGLLYPVYAVDAETDPGSVARVRYPVGIVEVTNRTSRYIPLNLRQVWTIPLAATIFSVFVLTVMLTLRRTKRNRTG
jgi:hypothetical protein